MAKPLEAPMRCEKFFSPKRLCLAYVRATHLRFNRCRKYIFPSMPTAQKHDTFEDDQEDQEHKSIVEGFYLSSNTFKAD